MRAMDDLDNLKDLVRKGLIESYKKMVAFKQQRNSPLVVSKNGRIELIPSDKINPNVHSTN